MNNKAVREKTESPHYLIDTSDGIKLFLRIWNPKPTARKVAIIILHGMTAHSGAYDKLGVILSENGYPTFGLDLRGHGLSDGQRGHCPSKTRFAQDVCETLDFLKKRYSRVIVFGHSLGVFSSLTAVDYCPENISGLILLSYAKGMKASLSPSRMTRLKFLLALAFLPSHSIIHWRGSNPEPITDPLYNYEYSPRFVAIINPAKLNLEKELSIPVFYGIGDQDQVFSVEGARSLFTELKSDNKKFVVIPHTTHQKFPDEFWGEIISWLEENFGTRSP